ncbi:MAG: glutamate--tRNA ligase [Verrucomicrobiales bacterium]|jgi:glutamyl-tRNA synthetase|nr:glutamate--tRNA ligase [Verrucomicrobiales bacterium]
MSEIRVRFAPSPTGLLHIGGARTALFNWLYARHFGGKMILRIEDTDTARNTPEAVAIIFKGLRWLGLDWDEGAREDGGADGDYGPYFQSQRLPIYQRYVEQLLAADHAYREADGAVRFRLPRAPGVVKDLICGEITFDRSHEPDPTIFRKDGSPVFHFVNVVDDLEMRITHVIRGEDHLSNTHKHIAMFEALGATPPQYAHIPLILNPGGSKMSKRDEGASIGEYMEQGYLPAAVRNYLCLLGWSPKDNREKISLSEVVEKFDLAQIHRGNARFDINKLYWLNGEYWKELTPSAYHAYAKDYLARRGVNVAAVDDRYLTGALDIVREKIKLGRDLPGWLEPFLDEEFTYDEKSLTVTLKEPQAAARIEKISAAFGAVADGEWTAAKLEETLKALAAADGVKVGAYVHPCRAGVAGRAVGPSLYHMLEVMGKERVLARLRRTLRKI